MTEHVSTNDSLQWSPPGPGVWEAEGAHFPRPVPRLGRKEFIEGFAKGFMESTARYGLLLSHMQPGVVNDFIYMKAVAFGAPEDAKGPPPKPILWLLTRLHPAIRARIAQTRKAFEEKLWREDLRRWDEVDKPAALARHRELLAIDVSSLDDAALAAHGRDVIQHVHDMVLLHHRYTIPCMLPVGDLLVHVAEWTSESTAAVLQMLRGSTPVSRGILASELETLASAIRNDPEAKIVLGGRDPKSVIDALEATPGALGEAARAFFEGVRHRAVSYEIAAKVAGELPEMLVSAVRAAVSGDAQMQRDDAAARIAAIRAKVPETHRAEFDSLVDEARAINRLRDERGVYADGFAVGIGRRFALEAGRRLAARGLLLDAEDAVDLDMDELDAMLTGKPGPSPEEVRARVTFRMTKSSSDIPAFLGGEPSGPPDPDVLPGAARRAARAIEAGIGNLFKESDAVSTKDVVRGLSVNEGVYEGIARVVTDVAEFDRLEQGDVLVTRATAPYFNVVLPLLGALVTDRGGQLCHAAIVAREYGIPGVVGTREATVRIPDGARVRVDGTTGEVTILSRPN
jgi:rifampicin phosphotransferase